MYFIDLRDENNKECISKGIKDVILLLKRIRFKKQSYHFQPQQPGTLAYGTLVTKLVVIALPRPLSLCSNKLKGKLMGIVEGRNCDFKFS